MYFNKKNGEKRNSRFFYVFTALFICFAIIISIPIQIFSKNSQRVYKDIYFGDESLYSEMFKEDIFASISYDFNTDTIIDSVNSKNSFVPSSDMVMLMTALIVAEEIEDIDSVIKINLRDISFKTDKSTLKLKNNYTVTIKDLLNLMLISQAQDAAAVLAKETAGALDAFIVFMNKKAKALGMNDTVFTNVNGYFDSEQTTTAADLLKLASAVCESELLMSILQSPEYTVSDVAEKLKNSYTNRLWLSEDLNDSLFALASDVSGDLSMGIYAEQKEGFIISIIVGKNEDYSFDLAAAEIHNIFYENFTSIKSFEIAEDLCENIFFRVENGFIKGYIKEKNFPAFTATKSFYEAIQNNNLDLTKYFEIKYKDGYIYKEIKTDDIIVAADFVYMGEALFVAPVYASSERVDSEILTEAKQGEDVKNNLFNIILITISIAASVAVILVFIIYIKRKNMKK